MKIAIYKMGNYEHVSEMADWKETDGQYVRLTEPVEVEFMRLPQEVTIPLELAALDRAEEHLIAKHLEELKPIQSRRKDLLSLAPPTVVSSEVA